MAVARASCLYCGAELPRGEGPPAPDVENGSSSSTEGPEPEKKEGPARILLVLDLLPVSGETLARGLHLSPYEADLLARRGGYHLHRILPEGEVEPEARRLREAGLRVELLPESEVRAEPLRAFGGERGRDRLELRTAEGPLDLHKSDIFLIVRGAITRQYQPTYRRRRVDVASLEEGFRVHFHRRSEMRPVEIEATNFEFGFTVTGSARLEIDSWIRALGDDIMRDDGFRLLPPAFGVAEAETEGPLGAMASLGRHSRQESGSSDEIVVLDNARQFVFYSSWRAALERRRAD